MYNGYPKAEVNTEKGCLKLGIEHMKSGILTRGIIIDIPRLKGVPYLESGVPIYTEDLDAWEKTTGVQITPGDAVFVRTGRWARREKVGPWKVSESVAGLHASTGPWFKARDVAFLEGLLHFRRHLSLWGGNDTMTRSRWQNEIRKIISGF